MSALYVFKRAEEALPMFSDEKKENIKVERGNAIAIKLNKIGKCYSIYEKPYHRFLQGLLPGKKKYHDSFWALKNISFEVRKGETLGIIGANGAGKSTLLQIISGTLEPSTGEVEVNGRVTALLELGAGFNPEFTGRENVFMYGSVLSIPKSEIETRYKEITDFADIGEFIDQPVKKYSSGMYIRLAFAISACVDPDILIIDEALAVGDTRFQLKCIKRLRELKEQGKTILFVSHSMEMVKRFCENAIWLKYGEICQRGIASYVCDKYYSESIDGQEVSENKVENLIHKTKSNNRVAEIKTIKMEKLSYYTFDKLKVMVEYEILDHQVDDLLIGVAIRRQGDDLYLFGPNTSLDNFTISSSCGIHVIDYEIEKLMLGGGNYYIDVGIFFDKGLVCLDYKSQVQTFEVKSTYQFEGMIFMDHQWKCRRNNKRQ